jgi:hypothetical protein
MVPISQEVAAPSWSKYCSLDGINLSDGQDRALLQQFADRCEPADACILACSRTVCANVGGGCFHACSQTQDPVKSAEEFAAGTSVWCKWRRPNNSFKPSPLRGLGTTRFASGGPA